MLSFGEVNAPGLGDVGRLAYKRPLQGETIGKGQVGDTAQFLSDFLKQASDPSAAIFEFSRLGNEYPGVREFEPGSKLYKQMFKAGNEPVSVRDADYLSTTMLGRSLTGDERKYVRKEDPSSYKFAGYLAANPRATLTDFPTDYENKISAYYGRMTPPEKEGAGFTGKRFSSIAPVEYTGGRA
jgi:hypothetical protein